METKKINEPSENIGQLENPPKSVGLESEDLEQEISRYLRTECAVDDEPSISETARHFAQWGVQWQKEQFEKNRLAACDAQTAEEYERETAFATEIIEKEHRSPTFNDAINYGMRLQKEQMAKETPDAELDGTRWLGWRKATKKLNEANCGIHFFGNLFPYLRKKGELDGLCRKNGREWEYDTDGIIKKARANKFNYK